MSDPYEHDDIEPYRCPHGVWEWEDGCFQCEIEIQNRRIAELEAEVERLRNVERDHSLCAETRGQFLEENERLQTENKELEWLFKKQAQRMREADKAWKLAHPDRVGVYPDLGTLLKWYSDEVERLDHLHKLDHSLADQWQKKNEILEKENERLRGLLKRIREELEQTKYMFTDRITIAKRPDLAHKILRSIEAIAKEAHDGKADG